MLPKVSSEQANGFAEASLRNQPRQLTIASTLFHDVISELDP